MSDPDTRQGSTPDAAQRPDPATETGLPPGSGHGGVPPGPAAAPIRTRGWVKALLAVSLALNLGIGGLFAGNLLREDGKAARVERDIGLGAVGQAMTREDWRAMRPAFLARHPDLKRGPEVLRGDFEAVLATLRADPFDAAAMTAALDTISQRNADRLDSAVRVISAYLAALPPEARGAFADRLEKILTRDRQKERDKAGKG